MSDPRPKTPIRLRLIAILLGVFLILWLSFEDQTTGLALGLAAAICLWLAVFYLQGSRGFSWKMVGKYAGVGTLAGLGTIPTTLGLMAFKTGLHAHSGGDYTGAQIIQLLNRIPIWAAAGLLLGLGSGLWRYLNPPRRETE